MKTILLIALIFYILSAFNKARNPKHPLALNVYFGVPGSGKTTFAAYLAKHAQKKSIVIQFCELFPCKFTNWIINGKHWKRPIDVYSNVPINGCYKVNCREDLGRYMVEDGKLIIDEAGVEFNSRNYKTFPKEAIYFFKFHRHYGVSVDVFSQSHEDMDVTLRRLAQNFFVVKKSLIPFFVVIRRIRRKVGIDDNTHQIVDAYSFGLPVLDTKRIFCLPLWKMFDTYEHEELPSKKWEKWGASSESEPVPEKDLDSAPEFPADPYI